MTDHRFSVGQQVMLERHERTKAKEMVEVLRQMPSDVDGEPQYRIKAGHESFERIVKEHQLSAVVPPPT